MTLKPLRILMIGPVPPPVGGARVLFKNTIDYLAIQDEVESEVIELWSLDDSKVMRFITGLEILFQVLLKGSRFDVISFWTSNTGMLYFGPVLRILCSLHRKPLIIRLFGVGSIQFNPKFSAIERRLARFIFHSVDLILVETQKAAEQLVAAYPYGKISLHKNYRKIPAVPVEVYQRCHRFIFLGKVREDKGILDIIEAAESMDVEDLVVDIYGPFEGGLSHKSFHNCRTVRYLGILQPENVSEVLGTYHALLLPTYYEGEGHPGAILEAYACGLPVIASNRQTIMEIVDESSGILIPARDPEKLRDAMKILIDKPELYRKLVDGALEKKEEFSLSRGVERFIAYCRDLIAD